MWEQAVFGANHKNSHSFSAVNSHSSKLLWVCGRILILKELDSKIFKFRPKSFISSFFILIIRPFPSILDIHDLYHFYLVLTLNFPLQSGRSCVSDSLSQKLPLTEKTWTFLPHLEKKQIENHQDISFHGILLFGQLRLLSRRRGDWLRQLTKALEVHPKAPSWQCIPKSLHPLPASWGWDLSGSPQTTEYAVPKMPEVSNSPRLLLKNPSPFFSTPPLFFILLQITRVGPLLIVLCVTSHQDKRRRGRGKSHMKILKQATGMSTDWWESLFLIHISLFTVGSSSLAIYGILSDHSWFLLSLSWRVGPYGSCCTSVGWK